MTAVEVYHRRTPAPAVSIHLVESDQPLSLLVHRRSGWLILLSSSVAGTDVGDAELDTAWTTLGLSGAPPAFGCRSASS